jgi:hypothetical protein
MLRWRALLVVPAVASLAFVASAGADEVPPPAEVVLPTPPVVTLAKLPTPWMRKDLAGLHGPLTPAKRARARIVARLKLTLPQGSGHVWFVTYRTRARHLCARTFESQPGSSTGGSGGLSCGGSCGDICEAVQIIDNANHWLAWSGTVPSRADGARLTLDDGSRYRFSLVGPQVAGARDRRIVLVQVPVDRNISLVEALQGDTTIASQAYGS